jgi:hypothetical protein
LARLDLVVEEYQIAFSGDNFFLLGMMLEITLANISQGMR